MTKPLWNKHSLKKTEDWSQQLTALISGILPCYKTNKNFAAPKETGLASYTQSKDMERGHTCLRNKNLKRQHKTFNLLGGARESLISHLNQQDSIALLDNLNVGESVQITSSSSTILNHKDKSKFNSSGPILLSLHAWFGFLITNTLLWWENTPVNILFWYKC